MELYVYKNLISKLIIAIFIFISAFCFTGITVIAAKVNMIMAEQVVDEASEQPTEPPTPSYINITENSSIGSYDWYKAVDGLFPREADAVVLDIETGKIFNIKRTYGTNHADIEPLTKEDAKIIEEIWGGFSWDKRAVVVFTGEHILAGSMHGMPHAGRDNKPSLANISNRSGGFGKGLNYDAVKDNGIDGHMCIHFKNSKNHNTNSVQKEHQKNVKLSAEYIAINYSK